MQLAVHMRLGMIAIQENQDRVVLADLVSYLCNDFRRCRIAFDQGDQIRERTVFDRVPDLRGYLDIDGDNPSFP